MLVRINDDEAELVTINVLKQAYLDCKAVVNSYAVPQEQRDYVLDIMVGFPLVLRYFLTDDEYDYFFERMNEDAHE